MWSVWYKIGRLHVKRLVMGKIHMKGHPDGVDSKLDIVSIEIKYSRINITQRDQSIFPYANVNSGLSDTATQYYLTSTNILAWKALQGIMCAVLGGMFLGTGSLPFVVGGKTEFIG